MVAYLSKAISKSGHDMPAVLTAAELLTSAAEHGGPVELARIGCRRSTVMLSAFSIPIAKSLIGDVGS
jgi:hypothetical protein